MNVKKKKNAKALPWHRRRRGPEGRRAGERQADDNSPPPHDEDPPHGDAARVLPLGVVLAGLVRLVMPLGLMWVLGMRRRRVVDNSLRHHRHAPLSGWAHPPLSVRVRTLHRRRFGGVCGGRGDVLAGGSVRTSRRVSENKLFNQDRA